MLMLEYLPPSLLSLFEKEFKFNAIALDLIN
jgi:hypothetical protein